MVFYKMVKTYIWRKIWNDHRLESPFYNWAVACLDRRSDARMNSVSLLDYRDSVPATSSIRKEDGTVQVNYSNSVWHTRKRIWLPYTKKYNNTNWPVRVGKSCWPARIWQVQDQPELASLGVRGAFSLEWRILRGDQWSKASKCRLIIIHSNDVRASLFSTLGAPTSVTQSERMQDWRKGVYNVNTCRPVRTVHRDTY